MPKRKWTTPQLVVLVRGKPEEGVLAACKSFIIGQSGPSDLAMQCGEFRAARHGRLCTSCANFYFT